MSEMTNKLMVTCRSSLPCCINGDLRAPSVLASDPITVSVEYEMEVVITAVLPRLTSGLVQ